MARFGGAEALERFLESADAEALNACINAIYADMDGEEAAHEYHNRHMTDSMLILTVTDCADVEDLMARIANRIRGKRVVEIGAGVGLLALAMASIASSVVAIEVDPSWSWAFTQHLYRHKPG